MDETDHRLIRALRHDARASISELADRLGLSRTTVRSRMGALQQRGEIVGYTIVTRADVRRDPVRGLMMIGIEGRGMERITRQISQLPEARTLHATNGRWDIIVEIGTDTLDHFDDILRVIRRMDGVVASETSLLLKTHKSG